MLKVRHIAVFLLAAAALASCGGKDRIIPRGDMAKIYADMYVADQWIALNSDQRIIADTTLVYNPIFEKYGFNTDDYLASVAYYMKDPERYSKILRNASKILEDEVKKITREQERLDKAAGMHHPDMWNDIDFTVPVLDTVFVRIVDTNFMEGLRIPEKYPSAVDTLCVE